MRSFDGLFARSAGTEGARIISLRASRLKGWWDDGGDASGDQVLRVPDRGGAGGVCGGIGARLFRARREHHRGGRGSGEFVRARLGRGRGQKGFAGRKEQAPGRDRRLTWADGNRGEGASWGERGVRYGQGGR